MVQRNAKSNNEEPEQKTFEMPSEKEHLFQVVDVYDQANPSEHFSIDDPDIVFVKVEVSGGDEEGRTILIRLSLDDEWKGFFATRLFLKSIAEQYKGEEFPIDTDNWIGRQMYATIVHNESANGKTYANIGEYNFEKMVEQADPVPPAADPTPEEEKAWDDDKA